MSDPGDYPYEMFRRTHLSDDTVEQLLSHRAVEGEELLMSFVEDATAAADVSPAPSPALAASFAGELSPGGDPQATAPLPAAASRRRTFLKVAVAKLAALGVVAKMGVAGAAVAATTSAAAFTGTLPEPVQDRVADAVANVGVNIPGGNSADHRNDGDHRRDGDAGNSEADPYTGFGDDVSSQVKDGGPEDGQQFGEDVSNDARDTYQPDDVGDRAHNPAANPNAEDDLAGDPPDDTPRADGNRSRR